MPSRATVLPGQGGLFDTVDVPPVPARRARVVSYAERQVPLPARVTRDGDLAAICHEQAAHDIALCQPVLGLDVEDTGYPLGHKHHRLKTIQLGTRHVTTVLDAQCAQCRDIATHALGRAEYLVTFAGSGDIAKVAHAGFIDYEDTCRKHYDIMVPTKLDDPNALGTDAGLKDTATKRLGTAALSPRADEDRAALFTAAGWTSDPVAATSLDLNGWYQVNPRYERMVRYAAADVLDTMAILPTLPRLPRDVIGRERKLAHMVSRIGYHGLPLDYEHICALLRKHKAAKQDAADALAVCGLTDPTNRLAKVSALQDAGLALPLTELGNPSLDAATLKRLGNEVTGEAGALVKGLLDWQAHSTIISTFLEPDKALCDHGDGRVRPTIYTLTARTGRMSSVRPNRQNVPRTGGLRACTTADKGYLLVSADLAGIEYRVAAALSGDQALLDIVLNGNSKDRTDLHWRVARQVFGEDATKADRYTVKPGVYGKFYGCGVETAAEQMGCSVQLAQEVCDGFDRLFHGYMRWARARIKEVEGGKTKVRLYTGTTLHLPRAFPHKAPNYYIQRTAREILVDCLMRWADTKWGDCIILPVHDEVIAMVPEDEADPATAALVECMTDEFMGVPITASANEPSFAWQDAD